MLKRFQTIDRKVCLDTAQTLNYQNQSLNLSEKLLIINHLRLVISTLKKSLRNISGVKILFNFHVGGNRHCSRLRVVSLKTINRIFDL